jgi:quinol monooxygenase YgiN
VSIVERARGAAGCLDFAITADLIDPGRVNTFERCESKAAVEAFRKRLDSVAERGHWAGRLAARSVGRRHYRAKRQS